MKGCLSSRDPEISERRTVEMKVNAHLKHC